MLFQLNKSSIQYMLIVQSIFLTLKPIHSFTTKNISSFTRIATSTSISIGTINKNNKNNNPNNLLTKMNSSSETTRTHNFSKEGTKTKKDPFMPTMIVFDLDDCLWSPEMYTLYAKPSIPVEGDLNPTFAIEENSEREIGVVGMQVIGKGPTVTLFDGARQALREIALDPKYEGVIVAAASSSEEPTYSHACLNNIEVLPGLTMRDMFKFDQIGRTGSLTSRKTTHFRALHAESGVAYNEMLFFDDCNWGDHCADVTNNFGVISQRTPRGMQLSEFHEGLEKYRKEAKTRK